MIRAFLTSLARFGAAVLLLALCVCAVEVGLRAWRLNRIVKHWNASAATELVAPSPRSWLEVQPLVDLKLTGEDGRTIRIQTNESGLRSPTVTLPKPRGEYRILCLGGSALFGAGVDQQETMPARLEQYLKANTTIPVEVLNAGCPDAGPLVSLLRYRQDLARLQPDLVLLCLSPEELQQDDLIRGIVRLDGSRSPAFAAHPAANCMNANLMDTLCREFVTVEWALGMAGDAAGMGHTPGRQNGVISSDPRRWAAVVPLHQLVNSQLSNLAVSVAPGAWSLGKSATSGSLAGPVREAKQLREFLVQVNLASTVPVEDSLERFALDANARDLFLASSGELSAAGHDQYARNMAEFLLTTIPGLQSGPARSTSLDQRPAAAPAPIPWQPQNPPAPQAQQFPNQNQWNR